MTLSKIRLITIIAIVASLLFSLHATALAVTSSLSKAKQDSSATTKPVKKTVKKVVKKPAKKAKVKTPVKKDIPKPIIESPAPTSTDTPASPTTPVVPRAEKPAQKTFNVSIENFAFAPPELKIKVGDSVTFTQKDSVVHTVDTDPHPDHTQLPGFDSGSLSLGQSYTHTFTKAGTFTYHCSPHPSMKGKIIVEE